MNLQIKYVSLQGIKLLFLCCILIINCGETDTSDKIRAQKKQNTTDEQFSFRLKDLHGTPKTLDDFKSQLIVIDFWATWCPPCRKTIPTLVKLYNKYNKEIAIVGISLDQGDVDTIEMFIDTYKIPYPVLRGDAEIVQAYNVEAIPTFIFMDENGNILKRLAGYISEYQMELVIKELLASLSA